MGRSPAELSAVRPRARRAAVLFGLSLFALVAACRKEGGRPGLRLDDAPTGSGGRDGGAGRPSTSGGETGSSGAASSGSSAAASGTSTEPPDAGPGVTSPREALLGAIAACTREQAARFVESAEALASATEAQSTSPSSAHADAARAAWEAAMAVWQRLEVFQFGPLRAATEPGGQGLRANVYPWPSFNRCVVDQQTANERYAQPNFGASLTNTRGLGAIEYLSFYTATDNGCAPTNALNASGAWAALDAAEIGRRRALYAHAAATDVVARAIALADAWDPARGNFSHELATAGAGSSVYPTLQAGFNAVSDAMFYLDTEVKDMKLAWPMGIADCGGPCPLVAESPFAQRSRSHLRDNLLAFRMLYQGCGPDGSGIGFDDVLIELGQESLAERMRVEIAAALEAVDAVEEPNVEGAVGADLESVQASYFAVKAVTDSLKTEFLAVLDLARPMGAEGDND